MFDIDERRQAAAFLRLRDHGESERGFAGRFGTENFNDASAREAAHAESAVDQDVAGGNDVDVDDRFIAEAHDRAVAVVFRDLLDREIEILIAGGNDFVFAGCFLFSFGSHRGSSLSTCAAGVRQEKRNEKAANLTARGFRSPNQENGSLRKQRSCAASPAPLSAESG